MDNKLKDIEQLVEAYNQLKEQTPTHARLALILLDNLIEIQMYRGVTYFFTELKYHNYFDIEISANRRKKVERNFKDRVNFLINTNLRNPSRKEGTLNHDTGEILKICHFIRNDAYHNDILREDVLQPIIELQFQKVAELLITFHYDQDVNCSFPTAELEKFMRKYEIVSEIEVDEFVDQCIMPQELMKEIIDTFAINPNMEVLKSTLIKNTLNRIDEVFQWLSELEVYQNSILPNNQQNQEEILEMIQEEEDQEDENSDPVIKMNDLENWRINISNLSNQRDAGGILRNWWQIDNKLSKIELLVIKNLDYVSSMVEDQIDEYRLTRGDE